MAEVEKLVFIDGLSDWITPASNTYSGMFILPVPGLGMKITLKAPISAPYPAAFTLRIYQYLNEDDPEKVNRTEILKLPQILSDLFNQPYSAPGEWEFLCKPTTRFIRWSYGGGSGINWGLLSLIMEYEVMSPAAYKQLMKGKRDLDKRLETAARSIDQFDEKLEEAGVKQVELVSANSLYENFLSDEIAAHEALYGTP